MTLKICVAQLNFVVGDMVGNARKIIDAARDAHARGIGLLLTPELALCGYAAEDLFSKHGFYGVNNIGEFAPTVPFSLKF